MPRVGSFPSLLRQGPYPRGHHRLEFGAIVPELAGVKGRDICSETE